MGWAEDDQARLELLAREVVASWKVAHKVMSLPSFLLKHERAMEDLQLFLDCHCRCHELDISAGHRKGCDCCRRREAWSCEGCGKPTKDKPSNCPCGATVCQVCWHEEHGEHE